MVYGLSNGHVTHSTPNTQSVLNMCDLFEDDYKEFVLGELTELWDNYY